MIKDVLRKTIGNPFFESFIEHNIYSHTDSPLRATPACCAVLQTVYAVMICSRRVAHTNHSHTTPRQTSTLPKTSVRETQTKTNRTFGSAPPLHTTAIAERVVVILVVNVPPGQHIASFAHFWAWDRLALGVATTLSALQRRRHDCEVARDGAPPLLPSVTPEPYGTAWLTGTGTSDGPEEKQETAAGQ
jgi:hypothetical protein